ncbi:hypothetical protein, partial [Streptomyces sparsus]
AGEAGGGAERGPGGGGAGGGSEPAVERAEAGRDIRWETGYRMHPWADIQPPGESVKHRRLWHSSPGSAG